ncbi:MAG: hypothetical protein V1798_00125, partial [Pseudomonadota bacterium]
AIELKAIGKAQKVLILAFLASLFFIPSMHGWGDKTQVANLAVSVLSILAMTIGAYRMARALRRSVLPWVVGMFVPVLSLLLVWILYSEATKTLKAAGLDVGLFGVGSAELKRLDQKTD